MRLHGLSVHFKRLAFALSLLALWSALIAPSSVLAQEMRSGQWIALCGAGPDAGMPHTQDGGGHCDLCALPALALPPQAAFFLGRMPALASPWRPAERVRASALERPSIRAPPHVL